MRTLSLAFALLSALTLGTPASAADGVGDGGGGYGSGNCPGAPGDELEMPGKLSIGKPFLTCVEAPPDSLVLVLVSGGKGPVNTRFGPPCISFPLLTIRGFPMPTSGAICLPHLVACDPAVVGFTGDFQFAAIGPDPGQISLSNSQPLTAIDTGACDDCDDDDDGRKDDDDCHDDDCDEHGKGH
jgi:hypothetical protein